MSGAEKNLLAKSICNEFSYLSSDDPKIRKDKLSDARIRMGKVPFTGPDSDIRESLQFGICEELVLDDAGFDTLLEEKRQEEEVRRSKVVAVTCAVIKATGIYDSEMRIAEVNNARRDIGEVIFNGDDQTIVDAVNEDVCEQFILNDASVIDQLSEIKRERDAIKGAELKAKIEGTRVAQEKWHTAIENYVGDTPIKLIDVEWNRNKITLTVRFTCSPISNLEGNVTFELVNDYDTLIAADENIFCIITSKYPDRFHDVVFDADSGITEEIENALDNADDPLDIIKSAYIEIVDTNYCEYCDRSLQKKDYGISEYSEELANPIIVKFQND